MRNPIGNGTLDKDIAFSGTFHGSSSNIYVYLCVSPSYLCVWYIIYNFSILCQSQRHDSLPVYSTAGIYLLLFSIAVLQSAVNKEWSFQLRINYLVKYAMFDFSYFYILLLSCLSRLAICQALYC